MVEEAYSTEIASAPSNDWDMRALLQTNRAAARVHLGQLDQALTGRERILLPLC